MKRKFKVGDRVKLVKVHKYWVSEETKCLGKPGIISNNDDSDVRVEVKFDNEELNDGYNFFYEYQLKLISHSKEVSMLKAKFGIKYDRDTDPIEFFSTKKDAEKRIAELLDDDEVDKPSLVLFEVGKRWEVKRPVIYELKEV